MLKEAIANKFEYTKLSPEEQQKRGILGRLVGIMADFKHPTRNGRLYTEELWDKVFKDPIMQEKLKNRCVFGELGHPADRSEIDMEKIAICLAEEPTKYPDGTIKGIFDILDTPNGRILKTMCDYGCNIGVSSRGEGDLIESWSGDQQVDPDTYSCECWDAVLVPAVKAARLTPVTESLQNNKSLKQSLKESLQKASPEDRKVMEEALERLHIDLKEKNQSKKAGAADNGGADVIKGLQEALKQNKALQSQIKSLQEKLSVCYAKEARLVEDALGYKTKADGLLEEAKKVETLSAKVAELTEQLTQRSSLVEKQERRITALSQRCESQVKECKRLSESLQEKSEDADSTMARLKRKAVASERELTTLRENLESVKQNAALTKQSYEKKLQKAEGLVERYKKIALTASNRYVEARAKMIGVSTAEIKSRLNESYSFDDIDRACDDLRDHQLRLGSLPFRVDGRSAKVKVQESYEPIKPKSRIDDEIDDQLLSWANNLISK